MKFDENGNRISPSEGKKSASQEFLGKVFLDVNKMAQYLKTDLPKIELKSGGGGDYRRGDKRLRVGFGDGNYTKKTRITVIHEMLHHKGHHHGIVMNKKFMSRDDHLSPVIQKLVFGEEEPFA